MNKPLRMVDLPGRIHRLADDKPVKPQREEDKNTLVYKLSHMEVDEVLELPLSSRATVTRIKQKFGFEFKCKYLNNSTILRVQRTS